MKFQSLRVPSLKVGASLEFESLNGNPAWKFEAVATRCTRFTEQPPGSSTVQSLKVGKVSSFEG